MLESSTLTPDRPTRRSMDAVIDEHFGYEAHDDVDGVLRTLAVDVDHDVVGSPSGPVRGRERARQFYVDLFADLEQDSVTSIHRYYGHDFVVDESVWRGTAVGDPLGFPGRGRPLEFRILHVFEFAADGAIGRENVWMDTAAIAAQLHDDVPPPSAPPADGPGRDTAKEIVARFYEEFDGGNVSDFDAIDPGFTATVFGTTVLDWSGFVAFGQSFLDAFPDGRHEFEFVIAEGDTVATIGRYRGRHDGELMGVAGTGNEVDFTVMHVDRVVGGRIVEHRGIGDINAMWAQLGIDPPTAG